METLEALQTRRSVRSFDSEQDVTEDQVRQIIDCGRMAPSGRNIQPWEFVVVRTQEKRKRLAQIAAHGPFIAEAPVCIAVFSRKGRHHIVDGAAATTNMLLAAHAMGLAGCWVAGYNMDYASTVEDLLGVPGDMDLISLIPVGYPAGKLPTPPNKRSVDDVMHSERFSG